MKRIKSIFAIGFAALLGMGVAAGLSLAKDETPIEKAEATTTSYNHTAIYLDTSSCWKSGNNDERFAIYWSTGSETGWYSMIELGTNFYGGRLPEKDISLVILCRMDKSKAENKWENKFNQTADLSASDFSKDSAVFKVSTWDGATKSDWKANSGYTSKFADRYVACGDNSWNPKNDDYKLSLDMTTAEARLVKEFVITSPETEEELKLTAGAWGEGKEFGCQFVTTAVDSDYVDLTQGGNSNIGLKQTLSYEIYWKYLATDGKNVWIQVDSSYQANQYAVGFLASITCTVDSKTFADNAWNKVGAETGSVEYKWENITEGARDIIKAGTYSISGSGSGTVVTPTGGTTQNIAEVLAKYDRILGKYGYGTEEGQLHDFMGRTPTALSANPFVRLTTEETISYTGIAILAVLSVASISAYFLLKKKRA